MTAPVQEPTPGREFSGLGYAQRQLFRRPAPSGTAPYPMFRARRFAGSLSVNSLANTNVCWDNWEICDDTVFSEGLMGSGVCANQLIGVNLLKTGLYAIHAQLDYEEDLTFKTGIGINDLVTAKMWHGLDNWMDIGTAGPSLITQIVRGYHAQDAAQVRIETMQNSGSAKNIGSDDTLCSNFFQIFWLGEYDCADCQTGFPWAYIAAGGSCAS